MKLARCYQTLELKRGASLQAVKAAYRRLVRQYHPDLNPDADAIERFIKINDAYTLLMADLSGAQRTSGRAKQVGQPRQAVGRFDFEALRLNLESLGLSNFQWPHEAGSADENGESGLAEVSAWPDVEAQARAALQASEQIAFNKPQTASFSHTGFSAASGSEASLKRDAYSQLKALLKQQKFPRAIALVEGLAHRMPADTEISQWQAIVYQRWGRLLIGKGQLQKARIYLQKALRTDPHNQLLCKEVNRDFWQLASLVEHSSPVAQHH